ncbi:MAG: hypothetical protein ACKOAK_00970 [Ignavibacteria bacterium]
MAIFAHKLFLRVWKKTDTSGNVKTYFCFMKMSTLQKSLFACLLFFVTLWFGGGLIRTSIGFDLFIPGTLDIKPFLNEEQINYSLRLMGITAYYTIAGYVLSFLCALILLLTMKGNIKRRGWLFMAALLFFAFTPYELYQAWLDLQLIFRVNAIDFVNLLKDDGLLILFKQRFHPWMTAIGFLSLLSYITALLFLAWQPLNVQENVEHVQ